MKDLFFFFHSMSFPSCQIQCYPGCNETKHVCVSHAVGDLDNNFSLLAPRKRVSRIINVSVFEKFYRVLKRSLIENESWPVARCNYRHSIMFILLATRTAADHRLYLLVRPIL